MDRNNLIHLLLVVVAGTIATVIQVASPYFVDPAVTRVRAPVLTMPIWAFLLVIAQRVGLVEIPPR